MIQTDPIADLLACQGVVVLDGGLATELETRGYDLSDHLWSARVLLDAPEVIRDVHLEYLRAGADCVVTASYQATIEGFVRKGLKETLAVELVKRAVRLACEARELYWASPERTADRERPLVAASVGPYGAFRADGSEYTGDYDLDEQDLVAFHRRRWELLCGAGADLLACETIPSMAEARALVRLLEQSPETWAWLSFSCRDGMNVNDGTPLAEAVAELTQVDRLAAVGINCTAPQHIASLIDQVRGVTSKPIVVYPNSGEFFHTAPRRWLPGTEGVDPVGACELWHERGASLIGGCCRVGPAAIGQMRSRLLQPQPAQPR